MALRELFKGIAVVIDDEIDNPKASISKIIEQIENEKIPIIKYNEIPEDGVLANFDSISFLLLDWEIQERDFLSENHTGVPVYKSSTLDDENVNKVVALIDSFKELCFCPIFIFTNLDVDSIKEELKAKMSVDKVPEYIFVKSKSELTGDGNLFTEIERWISGNPSVYVLKEWDKKHKKSKNKLFFDYQEMSPFWPCIMWKNFEEIGRAHV